MAWRSILTHRSVRLAGLAAGALCLTLLGTLPLLPQGDDPSPQELFAFVVRKSQDDADWLVINEEDVLRGATIPANTNVVFHVPADVEGIIFREILLGGKGKNVRYWGYCLAENYDPTVVAKRSGYPGLLFLSERERQAQAEAEVSLHTKRSVFDPQSIIDAAAEDAQGTLGRRVRHQIDRFDPGALCFIMTEAPLPIGLDEDGDKLNDKAEHDLGTDSALYDTDGDGLSDGVEVMGGTLPLTRDSDSDGLIDGLEDTNLNGRTERNETDPNNRDTDRDGLPDGLMVMRISNGQNMEIGEDLNLDTVLDDGETSPLLRDTNGDGLNDLDARYRCIFGELEVCP